MHVLLFPIPLRCPNSWILTQTLVGMAKVTNQAVLLDWGPSPDTFQLRELAFE